MGPHPELCARDVNTSGVVNHCRRPTAVLVTRRGHVAGKGTPLRCQRYSFCVQKVYLFGWKRSIFFGAEVYLLGVKVYLFGCKGLPFGVQKVDLFRSREVS